MPSQTTGFGGLLEAVPDALLGVDRSGVIRFVNHQTESMFGYECDDLIGVPIETLLPESVRQVHVAHRRGYQAAPKTRPMGTGTELRGRRRDGTKFPVDVALSPMGTTGGMLVIAAVRDMTHYQSAEADRRRAERLLAVVEHSGDAIIGTTLDGIITSWNPAAEKIFGYSGDEILGRSNGPLTPQDRANELMAIRVKLRAGQPVEHLETMGVRKDETVFPVSLTVSPIADKDGAVVGASTVVRDVSEAKGALQAARSMIEASLDSLVAISPEGKITDANEATVKLTGVPRDKLIGTPFSDYFTDPEEADRVYQQVLGQEPAADYHLTMRHHDGPETVIEVLYNASAYHDANGNLLGVFAAARDMTDQKKAAQYARSLIEATPDSLVAISPEGKITDVNEAMVKLTGVPRGQLIGTSFSEYFTEPARAEEIYRRVFTEGMAVDYPLTLRNRDGHEPQNEVLYNASVYFDADGAVLGAVAAARDMTRQRQAFDAARSMIEASLDSLVAISPEGKITDANQATVKLTGVPRDKLIGTSFSSYFTDPEKAEAIYQQVFTRGMAVDYPLTLRHQDGHETFTDVLYNASVYRDTQGKVLGVFAAARDVTNLMQAHRDIVEQQATALQRLAELEQFERLTVGRELKMIELKKEIEALRKLDQIDGRERGEWD